METTARLTATQSLTRVHLAFLLLEYPQPVMVPHELTPAKPCQLLWAFEEMPRGFVFQLPAGKTVWTDQATLLANREVAIKFDILFEDYLIAQYERKNKSEMLLHPLTGVSWARVYFARSRISGNYGPSPDFRIGYGRGSDAPVSGSTDQRSPASLVIRIRSPSGDTVMSEK